jgi:hypothetical protein
MLLLDKDGRVILVTAEIGNDGSKGVKQAEVFKDSDVIDLKGALTKQWGSDRLARKDPNEGNIWIWKNQHISARLLLRMKNSKICLKLNATVSHRMADMACSASIMVFNLLSLMKPLITLTIRKKVNNLSMKKQIFWLLMVIPSSVLAQESYWKVERIKPVLQTGLMFEVALASITNADHILFNENNNSCDFIAVKIRV